jgi:hypothetical protein
MRRHNGSLTSRHAFKLAPVVALASSRQRPNRLALTILSFGSLVKLQCWDFEPKSSERLRTQIIVNRISLDHHASQNTALARSKGCASNPSG